MNENEYAYIMRTNVDLAESLRIALANTLNIQRQNVFEAWIEQLEQTVPISAPNISSKLA